MEHPRADMPQAKAAPSTSHKEDTAPPAKAVPSSTSASKVSEMGDEPSMKRDHTHSKDNQASVAGETPIEQIPQVPFGSRLGQVDFSQDGFDTKAKVAGMLIRHAS